MILEIEKDDVMIHRIIKTILLSESLIFLSRNNICLNIHMKMNECSSYVVIRKCLLSLSWYRISETSLLFLHISLFFVGLKPKLTDLTITHFSYSPYNDTPHHGVLVYRHLVTWDMQSDFKCGVIVFLKVLRGLSTCTPAS